MDKIKFKHLSFGLKIAVIAGYIYIITFAFTLYSIYYSFVMY